MTFDVFGAKKAGYSPQEIATFMAKENKFDLDGAIKSGYSYDEVIPHLSGMAAPTLTGRLAETAKGVPRGFVNSFLTSAEGIAQMADTATDFVGLDDLIDSGEENELIRLARSGREKVEETLGADPNYRDLWTTKFGDAMGSLASFFTPAAGAKLIGLTGKVAKHLPSAGFATGVGAGEQSQRIEMAREQGLDVSEGKEDAAIMTGSLIGLSELAPVGFILKGLKKADMQKPFFKSIMPRLKQALASGSVEAVQEVSAGIAQDLTEKGLYNPNLPVGESAWDEITLGGAAGFTADLLLNAMAGRRLTSMTRQQKEREADIREREAERMKLSSQEFQGTPVDPNAGQARLPPPAPPPPIQPSDPNNPASVIRAEAQTVEQELGNDFPLNQTFTPVEAEGGKWKVEDTAGTQYGRDFDTANEAAMMAGEMGEITIERTLQEKIDLAIDQGGQEYSSKDRSFLRMIGRRLFHPDENTYTPQQVNYAANTIVENGYTHENMSPSEAVTSGIKIKDMTAAQQINLRRLNRGLPETKTFSVAEAKAVLGKNFGKVLDLETGNTRHEIRFEHLRNVLKEKNIASDINSKELSIIAEIFTGRPLRGDTRINDLSAADKKMLFNRLRQMPKFDKPTLLPQYGLRPYSTAQYHTAKRNMLEQVRDPAFTPEQKVEPSTESTKELSSPVRDQLIADLNADASVQAQLAEDIETAKARIKYQTETQQREDETYKQLNKTIKRAFSRFGLNHVGVQMIDYIRQQKLDADGNRVQGEIVADRETEGAYFDSMNDIFVALEGIRANPRYKEALGKPESERNKILDELASETITHETFHAMRQADLITQKELEMLEKIARTQSRGEQHGNKSYTAWAAEVYNKKSEVAQMEEAIAELIRDGVAGKVSLPPKSRNLLQRIMQFLRGILQIKDTGGYRSFDELIEGMTTGQVGAREQGVVRTLNLTEKTLSEEIGFQPERYTSPTAPAGVIHSPKKKVPATEKGQAQPDFLASRRKGWEEMLDTMDIPSTRVAPTKANLLWFLRNAGVRNSRNPNFKESLKLAQTLLKNEVSAFSAANNSERIAQSIPYGKQLQEEAGLSDVAFSRRLERAVEQGFNIFTTYYHGTNQRNIKQFQSFRNDVAGFFTTDKSFAESFAPSSLVAIGEKNSAVIYPVYLRVKKTFDARNPADRFHLRRYVQEARQNNQFSDTIKAWYDEHIDALDDNTFDYVELEGLAPVIRSAGFDSYLDYEFAHQPSTGMAVFDAENIKGVFADFDLTNETGNRPKETVDGIPYPDEETYVEDIMYSRREVVRRNYDQRIDEIYDGNAEHAWLRVLDRADVLDLLGYGDMPLYVNEGKITENIGNHRMSADDMKRLPDWIDNPMAVFDSDTVDGRLVMIAQEPVNGSPVVIAMQPDAGGNKMDVHMLNSAYDTPLNPPNINRWLQRGLLRYANTTAIRTRGGEWLNWPPHVNIHEGRNAQNRVLTQKDLNKYLSEDMDFAASRRGPVRPRVGTTGKYVGSPRGINTPQKLSGLLRRVSALAKEGEYGRFWYERSGRQILELVNNDKSEADKLVQAIAVTSPTTPVGANFDYAIQAYLQWKDGQPIKTGKYPEAMGERLEAIFAGKSWEGRKTNNFYRNLMREIDPSVVQGVTADIWMMRAFGFHQAAPSPQQYTFVENETKRIADKLGWEPQQVQAAIWVALKSRMQNGEVKKRTEETSMRHEWMEYKNGVRNVLDQTKHMRNWLGEAMKHNPTAKDKSAAKFDYADAAKNTLAQVSWETIPGATTNHMQEAFDAPYGVLNDYHVAMSKAFLDENGHDIIAKALGLPSTGDFEAPGYFERKVSPSTQTEVSAPRRFKGAAFGEMEPSGIALINAYAAARGILLRQDAVGWHRPWFITKTGKKWNIAKKNGNGVQVEIGRAFTENELTELAELMAGQSGLEEYNPIGTPDGVRLINFDYLGIDNKIFQGWVDNALTALQLDNNTPVTAKLFHAKTGYLENNWQEKPNGQGYLEDSLKGRPDLQQRVNDIVAEIQPKVEAVEEEFADKYGWTRDPFVASRRTGLAESAIRPSIGISERGRATRPITLGQGRVDGAGTYEGVHYGNERTELLEAERYGTGIKGAEAIRLLNSLDPRIKKRVYFYIPKATGVLKHPESGLGDQIHTQLFNNILEANSPAATVIKKQVEHLGARDFANNFESALLDAGYDGYAVEQSGVMVILNHDVPVNFLGTRADLRNRGVGYKEILQRDHDPKAVQDVVTANKSATREHPQIVPEFSQNASPEAQYVAANPQAGRKTDMEFMRRSPIMTAEEKSVIDSVVQPTPEKSSPIDSYNQAVGALQTPSGVKYLMMKAKQETINRYARLENLNWDTHLRENLADTSSIAAALHADRALGIVAASIKYGTPVYEDGIVHVKDTSEGGGKSLIDIMSPLYSETHGNLTDVAKAYAISQRSKRLNKEGKQVPVTPEYRKKIENMITRYNDSDGNIIKRWYKDWQDYNNSVITLMEKSGVLNDETAQLWRDYADYYPFYRVAEGGGKLLSLGQKVFGGMTSAVSIRRMKGGVTPINMDMMEAVSMNLSAAIQMSMKNIAQQRIVRDMIQLGLAEEVTTHGGRHPTAPVVDFKVNGKDRHYAIYDPLIYESMLPLDGTDVVSMVKNTFGLPATALRELVTRDPGFMAVNLLRDSLSSYATSGASLVPIISTTKGLFDGVERLEKMGVVGGYDYSNDPDNLKTFWKKELKRKGIAEDGSQTAVNLFMRVWDALGRGTTASDAATRNAVFDDVYAKTGNLAEASFQAMEVINFGRRGRHPLARMIGSVVPFLNARFQGLDLFMRAYNGQYTANKQKNRSQIIASAMGRGALLTSMTALYYMLVSDDDQYKEANDYLKDNNWIIPTSWGVPVTLPIPFEVGLIFKTLPETILATTIGERSGKEAKETLKRGIGSTLEVSPFSIQFAGPALEAAINYNSFTGREIVPKYMVDNIEAGEQSKPYTSEIAKFIGQNTNTSPLKWDHALTGYMGTMGMYVWDVVDAALKTEIVQGDNVAAMPSRPWYDYPIIKRGFGRKEDSGLLADAYDLFGAIDKAVGTMNRMKKSYREDDYVAYIKGREMLLSMRETKSTVESQLKLLRDHKIAIQHSDMPPDLKKKEIDEVDAAINMMLKEVVPFLKAAAKQPFFDKLYH